ncbi:putative polypeptide N-acetylgalactosaminyltransferase 8 [Platysternon megacephalum]|uniref:Putative polypeptide N-acetylgalactosaminyltransferase 8 n=1 Tax=Platysternon megacephalum TaxID=55544 RepID=A0A4D9DXS3_9SAUR|nr:putative polypeptide N-acetylgalactosaminyltransferase 8 [Platysternon megacephalum]
MAMLGFQRAFRLLNATVRNQIVPRANIASGAPEEIVTPVDQAIAMTVFFAAFLIPSGWILAHMEDYKRKPSE